jgi:hypothetical protein
MLLLMLVLLLETINSLLLTQQVRAPRKPFKHSHEHVDDPDKLLLRRNNLLRNDELSDEPRAISKNLALSAYENLPFPSAIWSGMLVEARSS